MPNYLKTTLKIALSALSLWLVFQKIDPQQVWAVIRRAHVGGLVAATALYLVSRVLGAERLRTLFGQAGLALGMVPSLRLYWLGMYYNLFLPGGIGGDGYKVYLLHRLTGIPVKALLSATLLDRVIGILPLGYLLVALVIYLLPDISFLAQTGLPMQSPWRWLLLLLIPLGHGAAGWGLRRFMPHFSPVFQRTTAQSVLVQVAQLAQVLVLVNTLDAPGSRVGYGAVFLLSSVVSVIPFTIGGAGARELTFLFGAQWLGLPADAAVAVSLLFYLITAAVSLTGVVFSFRPVLSTNDLST